jgi:hypothetical protein
LNHALLNPERAFWVTGLMEGIVEYEHHLRALLGRTSLRAIQWVNPARNRFPHCEIFGLETPLII